MDKASVSVIIPYYNAETTIERAVDSIKSQTLLPEEIIIIDDCSSHKNAKKKLLDVKNKYEKIFSIVLLQTNKNSGPGTARNKGWDKAKGKYIAFLDADDAWLPNKIEIQYKVMEANKDIKISCHHIRVVKERNLQKAERKTKLFPDIYDINKWKVLFIHIPSGTPSVMIDRKIEFRFQENMYYAEDSLLYTKILFKYRGVLIDENLCECFKELYGRSGLTENLWRVEKGEIKSFYMLFKEKYISLYLFFIISVWSYIKYIRRIVVVKLRNERKNDRLEEI